MGFLNTNILNPEPHGYWGLMDEIDREQAASDFKEQHEARILEALQDDEVADYADEAMGELFDHFPDEMKKIMNSLAKALVLGGFDASQTVQSLLSALPLAAEDKVKNYLFKHIEI